MAVVEPDAIVQLLRDLVRIPSINPDLAPTAGSGEADIAAFARDWLRARGVDAWLEEVVSGRPNVAASVGTGTPVLILCAHLDTVAVDGMTDDPFDGKMVDGRLFGRGSYDMKGGVAAAMGAASALVDESLDGRLLLALVVDEEYASIGAADFVEKHAADACIVTEPSELQLVLAHNGFVWFEIETTGRAAHGSRWDLGVSAIHRAAPIVATLDAYDRTVLRRRQHPLTGPASLHCAMITGGSGWSSYAESCTLRVERRTVPGEEDEMVEKELLDVVLGVDPEADVRVVMSRRPSTCEADAPIARAVRSAATSVCGAPPKDVGVAYWMDAAIFDAAGIPTVNIGASGAGAHAAEEWVDVESVIQCTEILVESARRFLA